MSISGHIAIGSDQAQAGQLAVLSGQGLLELKAVDHSQCLLIAARQLGEPIVRHGPFVMNTQEEITQALVDFRSGNF